MYERLFYSDKKVPSLLPFLTLPHLCQRPRPILACQEMVGSSRAIKQSPPKGHIKHTPLHRHVNRRCRPTFRHALLLLVPLVFGELRSGEFKARRRGDETTDDGVALIVLIFFHPAMQGFFGGVGEIIQAVDGEERGMNAGVHESGEAGDNLSRGLKEHTPIH